MSYQEFSISSVNPNDTTGGGGCVCDARHQEDCKPPFVVFYGNEMFDHRSPHPVLCKNCLCAAMQKLEGGETLDIGERGQVQEAPPIQERPQHRDSANPETAPPVVESPDPRKDFPDDTPDI